MHQVPYRRSLKTEKDMNSAPPDNEFLRIVSHELRTPTAAILGWAELLGRIALDDETLVHGIAIIKRNAQLQAQLIEHLIDFLRISMDDFKLDIQKIAILPTLQAAIETMMPLALAKDIKISTRLDPVSGWISGDTFRLQQVFTNLISNAIRFTPSGGNIRVLLADDGTSVEVEVSDLGSGISDPERIFEAFYTTKQDGMGMGLAICRSIIESHGGRLWAENGARSGASITFSLPVRDVQAKFAPRENHAKPTVRELEALSA